MEIHVDSYDATPGSSPYSPAPLGTAIKVPLPGVTSQADMQRYYAEVALLQIMRGSEAWERAKTQSVVDVPPKADFEYVLAQAKFGYFQRGRGGKTEPYKLLEGQFVAASSDGKTEYEIPHVLRQPEPELIGYTFKINESREGWILLQVPKDERKPLLIFKREHAGGGGLWMWEPVWFQL